MSHLVTQRSQVKITDLDTLDAACKRLGLVLHRDRKRAYYYGSMSTNCDAVIELPHCSSQIAVHHDQETGEYVLEADLYNTTLRDAVSYDRDSLYNQARCDKLFEAYRIEELNAIAASQGYSVNEYVDEETQEVVLQYERL